MAEANVADDRVVPNEHLQQKEIVVDWLQMPNNNEAVALLGNQYQSILVQFAHPVV